jgi:hypothetical protein
VADPPQVPPKTVETQAKARNALQITKNRIQPKKNKEASVEKGNQDLPVADPPQVGQEQNDEQYIGRRIGRIRAPKS